MARAYGYMAKKKESYKVEQVYSPVKPIKTQSKILFGKKVMNCVLQIILKEIHPLIFIQRFYFLSRYDFIHKSHGKNSYVIVQLINKLKLLVDFALFVGPLSKKL